MSELFTKLPSVVVQAVAGQDPSPPGSGRESPGSPHGRPTG